MKADAVCSSGVDDAGRGPQGHRNRDEEGAKRTELFQHVMLVLTAFKALDCEKGYYLFYIITVGGGERENAV